MLARLSALTLWALVAATAVFWGFRLFVRAPAVPANAVAISAGTAPAGDLARLLGAPPSEAPTEFVVNEAASRFKLVGVMAPKSAGSEAARNYGVALIAVDGKPAKAFPVGASLDGDLVLQSVSLRSASLGPAEGAVSMKLELPALPLAATGSLPAFGIPPATLQGGVGMPAQPLGQILSRPRLSPPPITDQNQIENYNSAPTTE